MPKYLLKGSYTPKGIRGVAAEGGSARRDAVKHAIESVGGTLEAFYFAFGDHDAYMLVDLPDNGTAATVTLAVNGSEVAVIQTVVLMTPEELDVASRNAMDFQPARN